MKEQEHNNQPEQTQTVAEPAVVYAQTETSQIVLHENFDEDWERALTVEEFRALCMEKLRDIYAAH